MLAQLARDQRLAISALQEGDGFQFMPFLGDIGQYLEMAFGMGAQIIGEALMIVRAHFEHAFRLQLALLPEVGAQALGVEVEQAPGNHVLILPITS